MTLRTSLRWLLSLAFTAAGVLHFTRPELYLAIMPPYLPAPLELVYISGVAEIAGGVGVAFPALRRVAGYGLVALLIAVFPANLHMAVNGISFPGTEASPLLLWLRLPLQALLIAWTLWVTREDET